MDQRETIGSVAIPANARPWDVVRATLPEGWGMLLYCDEVDGRPRRVTGCSIDRLNRDGMMVSTEQGYGLTFEPTEVADGELDSQPDWLRQIVAGRQGARLYNYLR